MKYKPMCFKCGIKNYPEKRRNAFNGIGVSIGTCQVCKEKNMGIIPARDWAYRAGEFIKVL